MDELRTHWPDAEQRIALRRRAGPVPRRRRVRRQAVRQRERNRDGPDVSRNADGHGLQIAGTRGRRTNFGTAVRLARTRSAATAQRIRRRDDCARDAVSGRLSSDRYAGPSNDSGRATCTTALSCVRHPPRDARAPAPAGWHERARKLVFRRIPTLKPTRSSA